MSEALLIDSFQIKRIIGENVEKVYNSNDVKFKKGELVYLDIDGLPPTSLGEKWRAIKVQAGVQFFMYCHTDGTLAEILGDDGRVLFAAIDGVASRTTAIINGRLEEITTVPKSRHIVPHSAADNVGTSTSIARADHTHGLYEDAIEETLGWNPLTKEYERSVGQQRLRRITYGKDAPDNNDGQNGDIYIQLK